MIRVLSLGAGVQSTTLLLMSCLGELPLLDAAVFADTQWEPAEVYTHLDWLTGYATKAGIPVHKVSQGNLRADAMVSQVRGVKTAGQRWASMPLYTLSRDDGTKGMIRRQCTSEYKIKPLDRFIKRELLGVQPGRRAPENSEEGGVCALGAAGLRRNIPDLKAFDPHDSDTIAEKFDVAACMVREIEYENDEGGPWGDETPEARWIRIRKWVVGHLSQPSVAPATPDTRGVEK